MNNALNRRIFLETCSKAALGAGLVVEAHTALGEEKAESKLEDENAMTILQCPLDWLNAAYKHAAEDNVLAALNPKVFFGCFSVCADGQGFGYANSYPSLDGHQLSHAPLFLGKTKEVLANWEFVKHHQKPDGHLPIMIDAKGEGLYVHWCPGDPLRALGPVTYAHNAYAIFTHTLDEAWLRANLPSINLAMEYLATLISAEGRVGGAGFYVEMPTRIEWDGVTQCYAVDALDRVAKLNRRAGDEKDGVHWAALADRVRGNFTREFWHGDHCVEYIHPEHGPIDRHGLTDVDWAALALEMLPAHSADGIWQRVKDESGFRYGGMPTGIATAPDTYEDWEFIPADKYPNQDRRHDLAANWWPQGWRATIHVGGGLLSLQGEDGLLKGSWRDRVARRLSFIAPPNCSWHAAKTAEDLDLTINGNEAVRSVPAGTHFGFELPFA